MYIGVDYYPEHWPQARWETDAQLMQKAGLNIVRMGEFAWVNFEPEEGRFEFGWLDQALATLHRHGISAILGTPTAAMPAWVQKQYPDVMAVEKNGQRLVWGVRRNNCMSSQTYRQLSQRITQALAEHYALTPNVIGWQTDNEFGGPVCYCDTCRDTFQQWLEERYGTLNALNCAWGTHFWGQGYSDWGQIQIPRDDGSYSPSLLLDWKRFNSWLNVSFQAEQIHILRKVCPSHFVTHNLMGFVPDINYYDLAKELDFVSWDNYPAEGLPCIATNPSAAADVMRGLKHKNFWIMETTAGVVGWGNMDRNPRPGELRKVAFQQFAHGCDHLLWFRWRACTAGREQYWHGLLGHDGLPLRRYRVAAQIAADLHRLEAELEGTTVRPKVAMIYDYESIWALRIQPAYEGMKNVPNNRWSGENYYQAIQRYYEALFRVGVNVDMVALEADFSPYKVVFASHLHILRDDIALRLKEFVKNGGVLVVDSRTAVKNESNLCYDRTLPGLLSEPLGIVIEEYEALPVGMEYTVIGNREMTGRFTAQAFTDWIMPTSAESLGQFEPWHMQGYAPLTRNQFGTGWGYYVGVIVKEAGFYDHLIADVLDKAKVTPVLKPPMGVEVSIREGKGRQLIFIINHTEETQEIALPEEKLDLLTGEKVHGMLKLERYGVAVLR